MALQWGIDGWICLKVASFDLEQSKTPSYFYGFP
jgi:hypothetical protein